MGTGVCFSHHLGDLTSHVKLFWLCLYFESQYRQASLIYRAVSWLKSSSLLSHQSLEVRKRTFFFFFLQMMCVWVIGSTILEELCLFEGIKASSKAALAICRLIRDIFSQSKDFEKISLFSQLNILALVICHHLSLCKHSNSQWIH